MAALRGQFLKLNDMENGNEVFFENSLSAPDNRSLSTVKITDYPDSGHANPEPVSDQSDEALEDFLSPQSLKMITGKSNLAEITLLEMEVDTSETSIGNLGQLLPNLKQLKLTNSVITSVRDLGTSLNDLTTLWLTRCNLIDLDGISCFNSIRELYLAYNEIEDLSSLSMLENLGCLDLEGNNVDDIAQVEFLGLCSKLISLTLSGNPVEEAPHPGANKQDLKFYDYRAAVSKAVPQLRVLDDDPFLFDIIDGKHVIRSTSSNKRKNEQDTKEDLLLIQDCLKSLPVIDEDEDNEQDSDRPGSSNRMRPSSGVAKERIRPSSVRNRPLSSRNRPLSSRNRPTSSLRRISNQGNAQERPESGLKRPESVRSARPSLTENQNSMDEDDSSDLTHGSKQVLCGNPVRALLARRKELKGNIRLKFDGNPPESKANQFVPEHSYHADEDDDFLDKDGIFAELKKWRENFEKTLKDPVTSKNKDQSAMESGRFSLSPTPPSERPIRARPTRRRPVSQIKTDPSRPQTACDFRPAMSLDDPTNRGNTRHVLSRSLEVDDVPKSSLSSSSKYLNESIQSNEDGEHTDSKSSMYYQDQQQSQNSRGVINHRPGTAAAAYKRKSRKHFT